MPEEIKIQVGKSHTFHKLIKELLLFGYERVNNPLLAGQFSVSGGNITVFPINYRFALRIDYFGDFIDSVQSLDLSTGKLKDKINSFEIKPNLILLADGSKIKTGDYVVHEDHGVGLFRSILTKEVNGSELLYICIKYLNEDVLYIPLSQKEKVSQYIGVGRRKPRLNRLGSFTWKKTYKKTYENIIKLAKELLILYATREISTKEPWKISQEWNSNITETFSYKETPDQDNAIKDSFSDITSKIPMDRLICGDVGFGKTEVAIRVAAQAVANGFQVAFLVPTTILAEQHYATLTERFKTLPVRIERLTRFIGNKKQMEIVDDVNRGKIDILIGTHRLFGQDLKFKNLGLYVVDEEQKFGVKDKERLKRIKINLNVLSLTATQIPRTLFMSLSGVRDMSSLSSAPTGRKDIETNVSIHDDKIIKECISREIDRGGQIYYLHNQVSTIIGTKNRLYKMFPKLRLGIAHGQLGERELAKVMTDFAKGNLDVLVCSTIIENGLDLPNVNTLIADDADRFGLTQLYQIRGRIGRSKRQAYALFTHKDKALTENAFKRFRSLLENSSLGSGYNVALSDLEIRGGGNILGREQHGNMESVGLVLYSKLLSQAVKKLKNKP